MICSPPAMGTGQAEDVHFISSPGEWRARVYRNVNDIRNGRVANWKVWEKSNVCVYVCSSLTAPTSLLRPSASTTLATQLEPLLIMNWRPDERSKALRRWSSGWRRPEWVAMTASRWRKDAAVEIEICGNVFNNYPRITSIHASMAPSGKRCWPTASFLECEVMN